MEKILITGSCGQLGSEITPALANKYGSDSIVATDLREKSTTDFIYEQVDVLDEDRLRFVIKKHNITQIYHLAAVLSARAESNPVSAWDINMKSLLNILSLAVELNIGKVFWPSSIAAFGPGSPKQNTPQNTVMDPSTVYGISKLAGERWLDYFNKKYGLDARSLRYPGIISYKTRPGGGTTDYAVDIFHKVVNGEDFECFLEEDTALPMMFIDDAVRATLKLMDAPSENISIRSSYNVAAISFTPEELFREIEKHINSFKISYKPDFRQKIADSWPDSIDDTIARKDWDWKPEYNLERMVKVMLENIKQLQQ